MTKGIFAARAPAGLPRCKRCGRPFKPTREGQEYGPKCAKKMAGQVELDSQALVSGKVLRPEHVDLTNTSNPDRHDGTREVTV